MIRNRNVKGFTEFAQKVLSISLMFFRVSIKGSCSYNEVRRYSMCVWLTGLTRYSPPEYVVTGVMDDLSRMCQGAIHLLFL
jgi:hypothetical protein